MRIYTGSVWLEIPNEMFEDYRWKISLCSSDHFFLDNNDFERIYFWKIKFKNDLTHCEYVIDRIPQYTAKKIAEMKIDRTERNIL